MPAMSRLARLVPMQDISSEGRFCDRAQRHSEENSISWNPHRCSVETITNAGDDTSDYHLSCTIGCYLENGTNAHDGCTKDDSLLPAEHFSNGEGGHGAEEAANVIFTTQLGC